MSTLFVAWKSPSPALSWHPVGRLEVSDDRHNYTFQYIQGAIAAQKEAGFEPLISFPEMDRIYESGELFPLFKNRILSSNRKDFPDYLNWLDLDPEHADPVELLGLTGERQTDSLEVFPKIQKMDDGTILCRFFLHGLRHVSTAARERVNELHVKEELRVAIEVNNPATSHAVQIQTTDHHLIGWAPRYLVNDLRAALVKHSTITAKVQKLNSADAPLAKRVLIELRGGVPPDFEPMTSAEYQPVSPK